MLHLQFYRHLRFARVETVELSVTAKARAKAKAKEKQKEGATAASAVEERKGEETSAASASAAEASKTEQEQKSEPSYFEIANPARVSYTQRAYLQLPTKGRYVPVRKDASRNLGVLMLRDTKPDEAEDIVQPKSRTGDGEGPEPSPPEPFEWTPPFVLPDV